MSDKGTDTRCIRTGCGGTVKATWSIEKGTVYQCEKCRGCGKGSRIAVPPLSDTGDGK